MLVGDIKGKWPPDINGNSAGTELKLWHLTERAKEDMVNVIGEPWLISQNR